MNRSDPGTAVAAAIAVLLGSLALTPVYASGTWLPSVVFAVAVVTVGGIALRWAGPLVWARLAGGRPAPDRLAPLAVPLVTLGQLALLTGVLTMVFAPTHAFAGVVPTWASLRDLGGVFANGSAEMQEQAVPALPLHGLVALTVLLVGLVAVVVDLVAVAGQQPALAGLGLLVVFCVPVATIQGGIGWLALVAPAAGLGLLLWADQRRRLAQRTSGRRAALGTGTLPALRIGGAALAVGIIGGGLVPIFAEGSFTNDTMAGNGSGISSTGTSLDPVATLHGQLTRPEPIPLLRLRASVADPGYLRSVSLDRYDPREGWSLGSLDGEASVSETGRLAALPGRELSRPVNARIQVLALNDRFLPVLTSPQRVSVGDAQDWRFDPTTGTVFGRGTTTTGRTYLVTAAEPRPTTALLQSAPALSSGNPIQQRYTSLPPLPTTVTDLVSSLTKGVGSPYARVRAILDYFTDPANGFVYSLSTAPGTSGDHLVDFLHFKRGYCEQYAGAMAAMVRAAGVPARVALGYTPGTTQTTGTRLITSNDAHAWVEVYFSELGWVPFDPTPVSATRAVTLPWAPRVDPQAGAAQAAAVPSAAGPSQSGPSRKLDRADQATPALRVSRQTPGWVRPLMFGGAALLLVLALAAAPGVGRIQQRRRRLADGSPGALWDELMSSARDLGVRLEPARTPRQTARDLAEVMAGSSAQPDGGGERSRRPDPTRLGIDGVRRLALAEEAASYAAPGRAASGDPLVPALQAARSALLRGTPVRRRLRSLLWPASLVTDARQRWATRVRRSTAWLRGGPGPAGRRGARTV